MSRRAKIVATLGPATASTEGIAALVAAGLDVARLTVPSGPVRLVPGEEFTVTVADVPDQGADAVMLSAETSVGEYPAEAVATMSRVVCAAEEESLRPVSSLARVPTTGGAIARAAAEVGAVVGTNALRVHRIGDAVALP